MNWLEIKSSKYGKILGITTEGIKMEWKAPKTKKDKKENKEGRKRGGQHKEG